MKLKVHLAEFESLTLSKIIAEFNDMPYRMNDIRLKNDMLEIDLGDIPIFWNQFLERLPTLKKKIRPAFIEAMRHIPEEKIGISFNKSMAILSED